MNPLLLMSLVVYSLSLWFGLYLLARYHHKPGLRYAGLGLVSYALGVAVVVLAAPPSSGPAWTVLPLMLPSVFWMGATFYLDPDAPAANISPPVLLAILAVSVLGLGGALLFQPLVLVWPLMVLALALIRVRQALAGDLPQRPLVILLAATLFFALGTALLVLPQDYLRQEWVLLGISADVLLLGYVLAVLDAFDEGTSFGPDALRSLLEAGGGVLIFGGQVALVMAITGQDSPAWQSLLFGLVTTLLIIQAFYNSLQRWLDRLIFAGRPAIQRERERLRAAASGVTRVDDSHQFHPMPDETFARLTRRAISHYADLDKLSASPLIQLPLVDKRLASQNKDDNVLARAHALKALLRESIAQLKPPHQDETGFSPADEWRYYNVLYFPYIVGLRPYSRRFYPDDLDPAAEEALAWFQTHVPERTLYNWQKTAAALVAQHLRDKMQAG